MLGKFQVISMQYGELPHEQTYHRGRPWKLYRWNLGDSRKALICVLSTPNEVFSSTMTHPKTFEKFQQILEYFANFQKFRQMKQSGKMLEPQVNYRNMSWVNHDWLKLIFLMKRHWFGDAWKISSDLNAVWWGATWTNIAQRKPLKAIEVKSGRLQKSTNMCVEYSKPSFFINDDWSEDFWKVSTKFGILCQLSKIQADETKW